MGVKDVTAAIRQTMQTKATWSSTVLRVMLGIVIFPHGAQKVFGWFGGYGLGGTMDYFTETLGLPWIISMMVILIEFLGSLMLILGFYTRASAAAVFALFVGIIFQGHLQYGFFMNWYGNQAGEGFEYHLLVLAMAFALVLSGAGKYSVDKYLLTNPQGT